MKTNIETILFSNYKDGKAPGNFTPKYFEGSDLTVGDLSKYFKHHRSQLKDLRRMGPRCIRELKRALERTGSLEDE